MTGRMSIQPLRARTQEELRAARITVRLDSRTERALHRYSDSANETVSQVIRAALEEYLARHERSEGQV